MKTILSTRDNWEYLTSEHYAEHNGSEYDADDLNYDVLSQIAQEFYTEDLSYINCELKEFIKRYEKRYRTIISTIVFLGSRSSHYGSIGGGGADVGISANGINLQHMYFDADDVEYNIEDGHLNLVTYDHDGRNYMTMILVTENEVEKADALGLDIREYLDGNGINKSPTKLDKAFLNAFGYEVSKQTA